MLVATSVFNRVDVRNNIYSTQSLAMKLKYLTIILIVELQSGIGLLEMETELYGGIILMLEPQLQMDFYH